MCAQDPEKVQTDPDDLHSDWSAVSSTQKKSNVGDFYLLTWKNMTGYILGLHDISF